MAGAQTRAPRKSLFKQLNILPVACQCTLSLMNVINSIPETVKTNSSVYRNNTRKLFFQENFILCWHKNSQFITAQSNSS